MLLAPAPQPFHFDRHLVVRWELNFMAIWKDQSSPKNDLSSAPPPATFKLEDPPFAPPVNNAVQYRPNSATTSKESLIAAELTIEGKIQGSGNVRVAGHFKGDVNVDGNLTIESGARVIGSVRAKTVVIGGELEGNIESATHVELLETGILTGDLQAGSFVVAGGSRMRGQVSFGWDNNAANPRSLNVTSSSKTEPLSA